MGILDAPGQPRSTSGPLRNRPTATGSMRTYFATDDCGGTVHQDVAPGVWRRTHPRGELASVVNTTFSSWVKNGALTSIYSMYCEVQTDEPRPVDVILQGQVVVGNTGETISSPIFCRVALWENGVNLGSDYYRATTLGAQGGVRISLRRNLVPGTLYKYQGYYGSQDTNVSVRVAAGMELKVVEL